MKDNGIWKRLAVLIAFVMATTCITLCIAVVENSADKIGYLNKIELYRTSEDQIFAENEINCLSSSSADVVAISGNITLYLSSYPDCCLAEYPDPFYTSERFIYDNGDYWTWGNYSLKGDINGTLYSYRLYLASASSTTFKIEININETTVATFPLLTVPSDPYYQPFSGTVTGLDPTTSSGDKVALKITKISGSRGGILHGGTNTYITIPPLATQLILQSKIDAAKPGDTIIIEDGIYTENVKVNKRLTIRSKNGPDKTIVQAATLEEPVFNVTADYVNISGFTVKRAGTGIYLYNTEYCNISNNNCSNNEDGISLTFSNNNSISNSTCSNNRRRGIHLYKSNNNSISNNNCSNNFFCGILLYNSSNNFIKNNNVCRFIPVSIRGIYLFNSLNNKIYLNNFINTENVYSSDSTNIWNTPSKMTYTYNDSTYTNYLGNYWDDYKEKYLDAEEIDECGIWDTPYEIDSDKDIYPLIEPFEYYIAKFELI